MLTRKKAQIILVKDGDIQQLFMINLCMYFLVVANLKLINSGKQYLGWTVRPISGRD